MTSKKAGGGAGSGRPPPPARPAPGPPPQPKRPQLRPIGGAKAPVIRPIATRAPTAPRAPAAAPPPARPAPTSRPEALESKPDDDATSVMSRPIFESERALPKAKPTATSEAQRVRPAAGRPADDTRATRPDVDLVPKAQREPSSERTVVMPNAPARPPHAAGPRFPAPAGSASPRAGSSKRVSSPPRMRELAPTLPPPEDFVPKLTSDRPPSASNRPPSAARSQPPTHRPPNDALEGASLVSASPPVDAALRPPMPVQDETVAMYRGNWTPSAPPIAFGPVVHSAPSAPPPANVRTRPPSFAPPAAAPSIPAADPHLSARPPGVLGLLLFAAPLAFATIAVAALALL